MLKGNEIVFVLNEPLFNAASAGPIVLPKAVPAMTTPCTSLQS